MRTILRNTCILAALMILTVFTFSIAGVGFTEEIKLVFQLFGLAFILSVVNYYFDDIVSLPIVAGYLVKYAVFVGIVIVFGFIAGWFFPSNFWMAFIYVGVIAVIAYAIDSVKTEKEIEDINEMVKMSKNEKISFKPLKQRKGWKVLLVLVLSLIVLCVASLAGFIYVLDYNIHFRMNNSAEAQAAGYNKSYFPSTKLDNVVIDGTLYECYDSVEVTFAGNIDSTHIKIYIESGKDYIDGTEGKTDRLIIYCKDAGTFYYGDDHFVEPYSIYTEGKVDLENYCLGGFIYSGLAAAIVVIVLVVYFILYFVRRKKFDDVSAS